MDDLATGCVLAFLAWDPAWRSRLNGVVLRKGALPLLLALFLVMQPACSRVVTERLLGPTFGKLCNCLSNNVNTVLIALLLWAVVNRSTSRLGVLLNQRGVVTVGVLSYSLYLWHLLFLGEGSYWFCSFPWNGICIVLTATLSYLLVEKPFLALKSRRGTSPSVSTATAGLSPLMILRRQVPPLHAPKTDQEETLTRMAPSPLRSETLVSGLPKVPSASSGQ